MPIAIGVFAVIVLAIGFAVVRYRRRSPDQAARWQFFSRLLTDIERGGIRDVADPASLTPR